MSDAGKRLIKAATEAREIGVDHGADIGSVRTEWVLKEFHDAEIERLTRERDEARAAAIERCIAEIGIQKSAAANPGSFMYSVLSSAQSRLRALIDKPDPANG